MKVKRLFKKALVGVRKGYSETSKFVKTYGPPTHNYLKNVSSGISQSFAVNKPRNSVSFKVRPYHYPGLVNKRKHKPKRMPMGWRVY